MYHFNTTSLLYVYINILTIQDFYWNSNIIIFVDEKLARYSRLIYIFPPHQIFYGSTIIMIIKFQNCISLTIRPTKQAAEKEIPTRFYLCCGPGIPL